MPIPNPKQFKDKDSFISKCMEIEIGSGKDNEQAFAICNTTWENRNMKKTTAQIVNAKISNFPVKEIPHTPTPRPVGSTEPPEIEVEFITPNPCTDGYRAFGFKIKNGVKVPNCIPID